VPEPIFPEIPTLAWSVLKAPSFSTRIQKSVSGRELRLADQSSPIWEWTLTYEVLRDKWDGRGGAGLGTGYDELRLLAGFFLARRGSFEPFLYKDPTDTFIIDQYIGTGDGATTQYQIYRNFGGFYEAITAPYYVVVKDDGLTVPPEQYAVNYATGMITFTGPRLAGHVMSVDMNYYFRVRFSDDSTEYENFLYQLWSAREIKFRSVLP
jgi:uncharacterized protein (TIGR02217 family)